MNLQGRGPDLASPADAYRRCRRGDDGRRRWHVRHGSSVVRSVQTRGRLIRLRQVGVLRGSGELGKRPAPAQVGKRLFEGLFRSRLAPTHLALTNNLTHWGYGLVWGALFGVVVGSERTPRVRFGLVFGPFVWATGYLVLVPAKLYKPMWEYDMSTLWKDPSAHPIYGVATAATFKALTR